MAVNVVSVVSFSQLSNYYPLYLRFLIFVFSWGPVH